MTLLSLSSIFGSMGSEMVSRLFAQFIDFLIDSFIDIGLFVHGTIRNKLCIYKLVDVSLCFGISFLGDLRLDYVERYFLQTIILSCLLNYVIQWATLRQRCTVYVAYPCCYI